MNYRILSAKFLYSVQSATEENHDCPKIAFVGRSNVGKSSLINALCNQKQLARSSKTPGRTRLVNYFEILFSALSEAGERIGPEQLAHFVDLPGYGYAEVSKKERSGWEEAIAAFLFGEYAPIAICLLVDARRGIEEEERWIVEQGLARHIVVAITKSDKLGRNDLANIKAKIAKEFLPLTNSIIATSTSAPGKPGVDELKNKLLGIAAKDD